MGAWFKGMIVFSAMRRSWVLHGALSANGRASFFLCLALGAVAVSSSVSVYAQPAGVRVASAEGDAVGDAPDNPGPLATELSGELKPKAIDAAMKKVADWQVAVGEPHFNKQWTFAALYDGLLAA